METKKNYLLISIIFALFLVGCGKKKQESEKVAFADITVDENIVSADNQGSIPTLEEKMEDYLDDDSISEFAFVDEKEQGDVEDFFDDIQNEESAENTKHETDNEFEEEFDVAWEDEEQMAEEFQTVLFDLNKNSIREDQKDNINKNINMAKKLVQDGKKIVIGGHGCQLGSPSYNLVLSERRAQVIKKEMIKEGIAEENIKTVGYGQEMPVAWTDKTDKEFVIKELAPNRRAEIFSTGS
ncbi:OmpA family protein [Candidatus Babeliales bacterium]|nr:OmpA family protein [Candidatus Babeliales bacterium]